MRQPQVVSTITNTISLNPTARPQQLQTTNRPVPSTYPLVVAVVPAVNEKSPTPSPVKSGKLFPDSVKQ